MPAVLKPEDLFRFRNPGDAQLSPDGSKVAYVVSQADKKTDRNLSWVWVVPTCGGKPRRLTGSGRDRSPRWSPDGARLAFVSERSGKPQTWIMDAAGGEAWHLVTDEAVRGVPAWSPDGKFIAFVGRDFTKTDTWVPYPGAPEWDRDRAVAQARQALSGRLPKEDESKVSGVKVITRLRYRFDGVGYFGDLRGHIFTVNVPDSPGDAAEVKGSVRRLTSGDYDHDSPAFSPNGRYIAFSAVRRDDADYVQKSDLWLAEVATARLVQLMEGAGPCGQPRWSPDGKKIAFVGHDNAYDGSNTPYLWVLGVEGFLKSLEAGNQLSVPAPLSQKDARNLTLPMDRPVGNPVTSDMRQGGASLPYEWVDADTLMFLACDKGATGLYTVSACSSSASCAGEIRTLFHDPGNTVADFDRRGGKIAVQVGSPVEPDELFLLDLEDGKSSCERLHRLTDTSSWLNGYGLGRFERFTYKGDKGWDIDGWLLYPAGCEQGKKYPTVLLIHGGPHGVYGSSFMFQCQVFASKGYAVLYTDPRGSQSYGQDFAYACVEDWGGSDYKDIQAGVDEIIARGVADPEKLFVTGWSYGGYMTSWTITQTNRFRAAVAGAVVADRYSMFGTSDIPYFSQHHAGGLPWEIRDKYLDRSAVAFVQNVETPVLFIHGEGDLRCPISQSEEYYLSLKRLGKTAVMARYPGEFHSFTRPSHKYDRFERMIAWFDYYGGSRKETAQ